jgi:mannosyltransferase
MEATSQFIQKIRPHLNRNTILLVLILLLGLFLRIYNITGESLWLDEGYSVKRAKLGILQIIQELYGNVHPPFYFFILHSWMNLFGDSEFSIRFLSAIFGSLALFMIYRVGSLIFDKHVGLISSLILALSTFHIQYSQEVRGYSLMVLLTLLSMYFLMRLLRGSNNKLMACYVISSALLLYTHNFGLFIIAAQNIYVLGSFALSKNKPGLNLHRWILLQAIVSVLYLPWLFILIHQIMYNTIYLFWIPEPTLTLIKYSLEEYAGSPSLFWSFIVLSFLAILPYKFFFENRTTKDVSSLAEHHLSGARISAVNSTIFLLTWLLSPIVFPFIVSLLLKPIYVTRYTISASVAFYILTARGMQSIHIRYVKYIVLALIIIFSFGPLKTYYTKPHKQPWREVTKYVEMKAMPGDLLIFYPEWPGVGPMEAVFNYYSKRTDLYKKPFIVNGEVTKDITPAVEGHKRIWLILSLGENPDEFKKSFGQLTYSLSDYKKFDGEKSLEQWKIIEVYLFVRRS